MILLGKQIRDVKPFVDTTGWSGVNRGLLGRDGQGDRSGQALGRRLEFSRSMICISVGHLMRKFQIRKRRGPRSAEGAQRGTPRPWCREEIYLEMLGGGMGSKAGGLRPPGCY